MFKHLAAVSWSIRNRTQYCMPECTIPDVIRSEPGERACKERQRYLNAFELLRLVRCSICRTVGLQIWYRKLHGLKLGKCERTEPPTGSLYKFAV